MLSLRKTCVLLTKVDEWRLTLVFLIFSLNFTGASLVAQIVKNLSAMQETHVQSLGQEDPLEKEMATNPVFLPGKSHGQRNQAGYSPWGHKSQA